MSRIRQVRWTAAIALGVGLTGCGSSNEPPPAHPTVYAAYVLLAADAKGATFALARAIVEPGDPPCPTLRRGGRTVAMRLRENPFGFPVNVCEARLPLERRYTLSWTGQPLAVARRNPTRIALLGDSGCKAADCPAGTAAAPFDAIAARAAAQDPPPDLVVHVGDYNYRGTSTTVPLRAGGTLEVYDAGGDDETDDPQCQLDDPYVSQNAAYSANPDTWEHWSEDFFQPAAPLLAAAAWVVVRGNHELCSRAGPGWFYFLDPSVSPRLGGSGELACPPQGDAAPPPPPILPYLVFTPPYVLDLGALHLAVIDSANACDAYAPQATTQIYTDQLAEVLAALPSGGTTWIATHRPFWGASDPVGGSLNVTLQQAWAGTGALQSPPPATLALAGHVHTFQSATFIADASPPRPPQLIVGVSGVALEPAPLGSFTAELDGETAQVLGIATYGFLRMTAPAADSSWSGALIDSNGTTVATCSTDNLPASICRE